MFYFYQTNCTQTYAATDYVLSTSNNNENIFLTFLSSGTIDKNYHTYSSGKSFQKNVMM